MSMTGRQTGHSLQVVAHGRLMRWIQGNLPYSLSSAHNDTSGINALPAKTTIWPANTGARSSISGTVSRHWRKSSSTTGRTSGSPCRSGRGGRIRSVPAPTISIPVRRTPVPQASRATRCMVQDMSPSTCAGPASSGCGSKKGDEAPGISVGIDAFNLGNRVNYTGFIGNLSSPFFGKAIAAQPPRRIQLSAELRF